MFRVQMATYIFMKCTDIIELCTYTDVFFWFQLFVMPSWLACRQGLAAAQCHTYSSSSTLVQSASAFSLLSTPSPHLSGWAGGRFSNRRRSCRLLPACWGAAAAAPAGGAAAQQPLPRRGRRCGGAARVLNAGLVLGRCSSVLVVLESALDDLGLGATADALNHLDVLVILVGCQDCLQLRLEGVRLHFGKYIYHRALVLKCVCIDAVLERNRN
jgi:hypothetical protein